MTGMEGNREQVSDFCTENLIQRTVGRTRDIYADYINTLDNRADEACHWIIEDDAFRDWILDPCDTNVLAMFGATGCGKSTTTAFVVDYLASQSRVVCSYHFTDSDDTTDIGYVYRSLIWQLLCRKSNLKPEFLAWYMAESLTGDTDPTQSAIKLHKFLYEALNTPGECIIIVLDGLDACDIHLKDKLFSLFRDVFETQARLKLFTSSRHDDSIKSAFPRKVVQIELRTSQEGDRVIAEHHLRYARLSDELRTKVVDELVTRGNGSARWISLAADRLKKMRIMSERGMDDVLRSFERKYPRQLRGESV